MNSERQKRIAHLQAQIQQIRKQADDEEQSNEKNPHRQDPVWKACDALSHLFLDTDISCFYDYMVKELNATELSIDTLEKLLYERVIPVIYQPLALFGPWCGFHPADIDEAYRYSGGTSLYKSWLAYIFCGQHWRRVKSRL